jgi:hypothetical protein
MIAPKTSDTGQAADVVRTKAGEQPGERRAEIDQPPDTDGRDLEFPELQAEPAFEQDDRDAKADDRAEIISECVPGMEQAKTGTDEESRRSQQDDGRQLKAPGEPLRRDPEAGHHDDGDNDFMLVHREIHRAGERGGQRRRSHGCVQVRFIRRRSARSLRWPARPLLL